ncbi:hypothetical protein [Corynebacterium glaucum]|uniref:hypothetical protein n=1 Tax=Corynebacterium glaucum TaxID=187491 RepID=UPI0025B3CBFF|nr:hypothetical protein [Corynebacterium glaucum]
MLTPRAQRDEEPDHGDEDGERFEEIEASLEEEHEQACAPEWQKEKFRQLVKPVSSLEILMLR